MSGGTRLRLLHEFRRLTIRYEPRLDIHHAFTSLACSHLPAISERVVLEDVLRRIRFIVSGSGTSMSTADSARRDISRTDNRSPASRMIRSMRRGGA